MRKDEKKPDVDVISFAAVQAYHNVGDLQTYYPVCRDLFSFYEDREARAAAE